MNALLLSMVFSSSMASAPGIAAPSLVSVVVYAKNKPSEIRFGDAACRIVDDSTLTSVFVARTSTTGVAVCDSSLHCVTRPRVDIACASDVRLSGPGLAPRVFGRRVRVTPDAGALRVVVDVELESYTAGVVAAEVVAREASALEALAVVARTFAAFAHFHPRHADADLCDLTHCQVFRGKGANDAAMRATSSTTSLVLKDESHEVSPVFHHAACGGHTVAATERWADDSLAHIVGVDDKATDGRAHCAHSANATWTDALLDDDVARALAPLAGRSLDAATLSLEAREQSGARVIIADKDGVVVKTGEAVNRALGRALGWNFAKSSTFSVERRGSTLHRRGIGFGHRVGLCQEGARGRAREGASAQAILAAYFPRLHMESAQW